jgi:hypothetical protein
MSLDKYLKISGAKREEEIEVTSPSKVADELVQKYKEARYFKEKYGFLPISVWIPTKKGEYKALIEEYGKYHDLGLISTKKVATYTPVSDTGEATIPISLRNPQVDEWVFKLWGGQGYTIYNCFLGHTVEYIIFGRLGAKKYIGGTVNSTILYINQDFYNKHKHLVPPDYEVVFLEEDATEMRDIPDNSIDLIWASPPYWKAERLKSDHPHELAKTETYDEFLELYAKTFKQMYRVMRPDRFVVLQVGDVRFEGKLYPLHADTIELAQEAGLQLHDIVILMNFSIFATAAGSRSEKHKYTIKSHEYLLVFKR